MQLMNWGCLFFFRGISSCQTFQSPGDCLTDIGCIADQWISLVLTSIFGMEWSHLCQLSDFWFRAIDLCQVYKVDP